MALPLDEALPAPPPAVPAAATSASATVDLLAFDDLHVSAPPPRPTTLPSPAAAADPFADMLSGGETMPPVHTSATPTPTMSLSTSPVRLSLLNPGVAASSRWHARAFTASFRPSLSVCAAGDAHRFGGHQRHTAMVGDPHRRCAHGYNSLPR